MPNKRYQYVINLVEKYAAIIDDDEKTPVNIHKNKQNDMVKFYQMFDQKLREILNELDGDIFTLKHQGFNPKMLIIISAVEKALTDLLGQLDEDKVYIVANQLVKYVLEPPNKHIIDNLEFLIEHHTKHKQISLPHHFLQESRIDGLAKLKMLAKEVQHII